MSNARYAIRLPLQAHKEVTGTLLPKHLIRDERSECEEEAVLVAGASGEVSVGDGAHHAPLVTNVRVSSDLIHHGAHLLTILKALEHLTTDFKASRCPHLVNAQ